MKNRVGRIIVGLVFLFFFGIYFYKQLGIRTFSDDLASWGEATGFHRDTVETSGSIGEQSEKKADAQPKKEGSVVHPVKEEGSKPKNRRRYYRGKPKNKQQ